ncbi:DUF1479 domain protein [Aspergillus pseudotamarii]|uniref:DUF1479 domain protein n=1 Tax=Aspergillus pseudotamarii TaxID=132259 RepID=A0A5N6T4U5_ASPPS|nr:DUF1479 domain protein [Aspergillus pseudotamarii]KAE8141269.1 DUF1479 domain protein [Aspergillus pseudotamarii]
MAVITPTKPTKATGNIGDSFASLSGAQGSPLPDRFRQLKCDLVKDKEKDIVDSWFRLLRQIAVENNVIVNMRSDVIPSIEFSQFESDCEEMRDEIKKRGVVVVRGVIPEHEARAYKEEIEEYVRKNPHTRGFPQNDPQVYELYWSAPQLKARSHPSLLKVQRLLMSFIWDTHPDSRISLNHPLTYADRVRIRQPGDQHFALGPHMDGGSVERWETEGYGKGGVYDKVFEGKWEEYDPWDASGRVHAQVNLYDGLGACSMFRMWQGWMSMSNSGPLEGTLLVNPLVQLSTAYLLLRPFFNPVNKCTGPEFLDESNWEFTGLPNMTSELQGATCDHRQELNDALHPHLQLNQTMVHIPKIRPGDFVAWHCDSIHAVDNLHVGSSDSSVLYIPVCPITDSNVEYLKGQRTAFRKGIPPADFPGGEGEAHHVDRPSEEMLRGWMNSEGRQALGLERLIASKNALPGEKDVIQTANEILGFEGIVSTN